MIVNPPRSEAQFTSRLQTISTQAADKFADPDDRPPLMSNRTRRWIVILGVIGLISVASRTVIWMTTVFVESPTQNATMAEMYRDLAGDAEADAKVYQSVATTGKPAMLRNRTTVSDPVLSATMATQYDAQAKAYRRQAYTFECMNQGYKIR